MDDPGWKVIPWSGTADIWITLEQISKSLGLCIQRLLVLAIHCNILIRVGRNGKGATGPSHNTLPTVGAHHIEVTNDGSMLFGRFILDFNDGILAECLCVIPLMPDIARGKGGCGKVAVVNPASSTSLSDHGKHSKAKLVATWDGGNVDRMIVQAPVHEGLHDKACDGSTVIAVLYPVEHLYDSLTVIHRIKPMQSCYAIPIEWSIPSVLVIETLVVDRCQGVSHSCS